MKVMGFAIFQSIRWLGLPLIFCATTLAQQPAPAAVPKPVPSRSPVDDPPAFSHARKLMQQGKVDEGIAELETFETSNPGMKGIDLELGTAFYKKSDYGKAVEFLKKAVASDKAVRELSATFRPFEETVRDEVEWFRSHGFAA